MRVLRTWLCGFSLAFVAALALASSDTTASAVCKLQDDMRADRAFVLVVVDNADRKLKSSEAYGDWQSYLQSFIKRGRGELPVHEVTPEQVRKVLTKWPRGLRNGTLFATPKGHGLLHRGLVLEPQIYLIGKAWAEGGSAAPEAASYGLEPFTWK